MKRTAPFGDPHDRPAVPRQAWATGACLAAHERLRTLSEVAGNAAGLSDGEIADRHARQGDAIRDMHRIATRQALARAFP